MHHLSAEEIKEFFYAWSWAHSLICNQLNQPQYFPILGFGAGLTVGGAARVAAR